MMFPCLVVRQQIQSVEATGGVYKGQGHILFKFVTHTYEGFLVHNNRLQILIPTTGHIKLVDMYRYFLHYCNTRAAQNI